MESLNSVIARSNPELDNDRMFDGPSTDSLVLTLFTLALIGGCCAAALFFLRRRRLARQQAILPVHRKPSHHRSLTIATTPRNGQTDSVFVYDEKMNLIAHSSRAPQSPIPEIHITFPDEEDKDGQKKTGRVIVVRTITDTGGVGMEPLVHEELPPYQSSDADRFQSLDLDRIGGLREKELL